MLALRVVGGPAEPAPELSDAFPLDMVVPAASALLDPGPRYFPDDREALPEEGDPPGHLLGQLHWERRDQGPGAPLGPASGTPGPVELQRYQPGLHLELL